MNLVKLIACLILFAAAAAAQSALPVIKSNRQTISIRDGEKLSSDGWRLAPEAKPDIYEAELIDGKAHEVTFITDVERISFTVEENKRYDFIIRWNDRDCHTQIVGRRFTPAARFDEKYRAENKGKTSIEIPEVYELMNVAITMTPTGTTDENMIYKKSDYYGSVRRWFGEHSNHPLLAALDAELKSDNGVHHYHVLKMEGYSFEFDKRGKIVNSKTYDRVAGGRTNSLRPFLARMQSFADQTGFRRFYKQHRKTYDEQIRFYRDTANIAEMKRWLDRNFPASNDYDAYKIIFSPLVAANQSSNFIESDDFKELHAHVNYPYAESLGRTFPSNDLSVEAGNVFRGNIVFTEINHGYLNPEGAKYADRIAKAIGNRDVWVLKSKGANYYPGNTTFEEYMNWGLVSLRLTDYAPRAEQDKMIAAIDRMMTVRRGFPKFEAFDKFLVDLYRNRKPNQTVADLYPQIIEWFESNNRP